MGAVNQLIGRGRVQKEKRLLAQEATPPFLVNFAFRLKLVMHLDLKTNLLKQHRVHLQQHTIVTHVCFSFYQIKSIIHSLKKKKNLLYIVNKRRQKRNLEYRGLRVLEKELFVVTVIK